MDAKSYLVAGKWGPGSDPFEVKNPFDGSLVATVGKPTKQDVERSVEAAAKSFSETRKLPVHARAEALMHISRRLAERGTEVTELI
jgi:acyl-CoA reductase-like NAD-dependent aldehyde dehydrogenase